MYKIVGNYKIDQNCIIGRGPYAIVYACTNQEIQEPLCVKILKLVASNDAYDRTLIDREISILSNLMKMPHPKIIKIYDIYSIQENETKNIYIFMERCLQGHLEKKIRLKRKSQNYFKTDEILDFIEQIIEGYIFFSDKLIIHRDLKSEKIFFGNDGNLKISDFGVGKTLGAKYTRSLSIHFETQYASPQVLMNGNYSSKADVYSFGIIVYHLTYLNLPFCAKSFILLIESIKNRLNGKVIQLPEIKCQGPVDDIMKIKTLIEKTVTFAEDDRWDWKQIINFFRPNSIINTELQAQDFTGQNSSDSFQFQISQPVSNFSIDSNGQQRALHQQKTFEVRLLIQILMARQELAQMVEDHLKILQNKYQRIFSEIPISLLYASISGYQQAISINLVYLIKNEYTNVWEQLRQTLIESNIHLKCVHYFKDNCDQVKKQKEQVLKDQDAYFSKYQKSKQIDLKDFPNSQFLRFLTLISIEYRFYQQFYLISEFFYKYYFQEQFLIHHKRSQIIEFFLNTFNTFMKHLLKQNLKMQLKQYKILTHQNVLPQLENLFLLNNKIEYKTISHNIQNKSLYLIVIIIQRDQEIILLIYNIDKDKTNFQITYFFNVVGVLDSLIFQVLSVILIYLVELY